MRLYFTPLSAQLFTESNTSFDGMVVHTMSTLSSISPICLYRPASPAPLPPEGLIGYTLPLYPLARIFFTTVWPIFLGSVEAPMTAILRGSNSNLMLLISISLTCP